MKVRRDSLRSGPTRIAPCTTGLDQVRNHTASSKCLRTMIPLKCDTASVTTDCRLGPSVGRMDGRWEGRGWVKGDGSKPGLITLFLRLPWATVEAQAAS